MIRHLRQVIVLVALTLLAGCATAAPPTASMSATAVATATVGPEMPSMSALATPSPSPTPSTTPEPAAGDWRPVPTQETVTATQFDQVVWTGERFVAVGSADPGAFLDSVDGLIWHRQTLNPTWSPVALNRLEDGRLVASGTVKGRGASWQSMDGLTWTVSTGHAAVPGSDVAMSGGAWVAVGGLLDYPCVSYCEPLRGLAWTSADGTHWARAAPQASLEAAELTTVIRFGNRWVAGGTRKGSAATWSSRDGVHWARSSSPVFRVGDPASVGGVADLAILGSMLVAVGTDGGQDASRARAWWSTDGRTWHEATVAHAEDSQLFHVASTGDELLATGPSMGCPGGIWASADGRTWSCAASGDRIALFGAYDSAGSATIEIAAGLTDEGYDEEGDTGFAGAVWWRPRPAPVP